MRNFIAALPMYDWPEVRGETDRLWERLREALRVEGIAAPERLARRNGDLPPVPGGILDHKGVPAAADPAELPPDDLDFTALWRHPQLLFAQTCWGPLEGGLAAAVQLVGQPLYDAVEGGKGQFYSSAIIMPSALSVQVSNRDVAAPEDGRPLIPLDLMRDKRFAFNSLDSMSGLLALARDLERCGGIGVFSERIATGGHRDSVVALAEGHADVAAIDCRSWQLARRFEPAANDVVVVGWTAWRLGLPYITALSTPPPMVARIKSVVERFG